jgi:hypothetical protein
MFLIYQKCVAPAREDVRGFLEQAPVRVIAGMGLQRVRT